MNKLIIFKNSYDRFDSTIAEIIFSIEKSFLNFTKVKTKTREFVRNRANDILTNAQFFALRDFNKIRFVATTITTTQTFFQKHFIANVTNESFFLSKNENDENVTENEIEKKTIHFEQFFEIEKSENFEIEFVNDDEFNQNVVLFIEKTKIIIFVSRRKRQKIRISILRQIIIEKKTFSSMLSEFFRKNARIYAIS